MLSTLDLQHTCGLVMGWAQEAGAMALEAFGRDFRPRRKPDASPVTDVDEAIEAWLIERIIAHFPDHGIVGEESPRRVGSGRWTWVIDPLDGTRNFAQGVPLFCVAIALMDGGVPVIGIIHNPVSGTTYHGCTGGGAFSGDRAVHVAAEWTRDSLIAIAVGRNQRWSPTSLSELFALGILRNTGSTSQHLAWVAAGGLTVACARNAKLWDVAPGAVLVVEAGGVLTGLNGAPLFPIEVDTYAGGSMPFIAAAPSTHADVLAILAS